MENPFKKRATEFIEDRGALLALISPQPVRAFFEENASNFFDKLVVVVGTPGSGKTTIAKLLEFSSLRALHDLAGSGSFRDVIAALNDCGILDGLDPRYLAYRLPPSSNFREIWELPYSESIRSTLLRSFVQAKTVLGWMRQLEREGFSLDTLKIECREGTEAKQRLLHLPDSAAFRERARVTEEEIYRATTALVPPSERELAQHIQQTRFDAFDVVQSMTVNALGKSLSLKPMVMLDDAHELHPRQFSDLDVWLRSREMKIARWIMTRIDAVNPEDLRSALNASNDLTKVPGSSPGRDRLLKLIQRSRRDRMGFRAVARDIARRYMEQMPALRRRGVRNLEDCLTSTAQLISASDLKTLRLSIESIERDLQLTPLRKELLWQSIQDNVPEDERLAAYRILLYREKRRIPQRDIFGGIEGNTEPRRAKPSLVDGAAIQLMHQFGRPYYCGFDRLSDASSDNIEQFINLAGSLVEAIEGRLVRGRDVRLDAREQHRRLVERAQQTMEMWDFPHCGSVRRLVHFIARRCTSKTLEPNAPLDDGANAFGVPQEEMEYLREKHPELVHIIHFALAYNAIALIENYECKDRNWCLFELGGLPILANRLTLHRGGFCEGHLQDLAESVGTEVVAS